MRNRPRIYFSFRSPYSWLAYRDLVDRYPQVATEAQWRPFWEPDPRTEAMLHAAGGSFPYVDMSRAKHFYVLVDVDRLRRERGLSITWPVDREPVWEVPHLAYLVAADAGLGAQFIDRVYQARWSQGRDICAAATMAAVAGELGLPEKQVVGAADDDEMRGRGVKALLEVDRDGVFGVPFFVHGRHKFWGVDRLAAFVRSVTGEPPPSPVDGAPPLETEIRASADQGHAGGCG
ncbi:MAG TPA: DsbA family protein [Micromonosporaceae bacterium]|nr:DsbA family protein [Micromonosporaceae bacterium]